MTKYQKQQEAYRKRRHKIYAEVMANKLSQREIGDKYGITNSRVGQIVEQVVKELEKEMGNK